MTEIEWLLSTDPMAMLRYLSPDLYSPEVLRLNAACIARAPDLQYPALRASAKAAQFVAAGRASVERLKKLEERTCVPPMFWKLTPAGYAIWDVLACCWRDGETLYSECVEGQDAIREEKKHQANFIREIFGNPFRKEQLAGEEYHGHQDDSPGSIGNRSEGDYQ